MTEFFIYEKDKNKISPDQTILCENKNIFLLPKVDLEYYKKNGLFEEFVIEWCKQFCSIEKNFIDIGSHCGTYTINLAKYNKHVYAFEPQKIIYYALCGGVVLSGYENVTCLNYGLGSDNQNGEQILYIGSEDRGGSSLYDPGNTIKIETVQIKTLDSFNFENVGFIKLDAEDNELEILKGGINTLNKDKPIILFECNDKLEKLPKIINFLDSINYSVTNLTSYNNLFLAGYKN